MQPQVARLSQPQTLDCCRPSTASPMPRVISTVPTSSIGAGCFSSSGFDFQIRTRAMIATGMLTQKIARQVISTR